MRLVAEWHKAWKWLSIQVSALGAAAMGAWALLPEDLKSYVPHRVAAMTAAGIFVAVIAGRLIAQNGKKDDVRS